LEKGVVPERYWKRNLVPGRYWNLNFVPGRYGCWKTESCFTRSSAKKIFLLLKPPLSKSLGYAMP
jgi:hypothetical protein